MPVVSSYKPGMFCWTDLGTTDVDAAEWFYAEMFGWKTDDPGSFRMFLLDGHIVAAVYPQSGASEQGGPPPMWLPYVSVTDVGEVADKAGELGATIQIGPRDISDAGKMALVKSPTDELFGLWQPVGRIGAELVNEHGSLVWNELWSTDVERSRTFYMELFGYTARDYESGYVVFKTEDRPAAGLQALPEGMPGHPSYWLTYFEVNDTDKAVEMASGLGAKVLDGPRSLEGIGRFATMQDPQRAAFAVIATEGAPPPIDW